MARLNWGLPLLIWWNVVNTVTLSVWIYKTAGPILRLNLLCNWTGSNLWKPAGFHKIHPKDLNHGRTNQLSYCAGKKLLRRGRRQAADCLMSPSSSSPQAPALPSPSLNPKPVHGSTINVGSSSHGTPLISRLIHNSAVKTVSVEI